MIIIDGIIFSLQKAGGISVYFYELLKYIQKANKEYLHLLYNNQNAYANGNGFIINSKTRLHISFERFRRVPIIGDETDIFHSSYYRLPERSFSGKIITTVHDFTEEMYPRGIVSKIHHIQKRNAILGSDGIICISKNTMMDMHRLIPESIDIPTTVIYNGVGDFKSKECLGEYEPYVIFVGARNGYKNFNMCISALKKINDIRLVVVGGGGFTDNELKLLNTLIPGRYSHAGFITEIELNKLYQNSLALIYPSSYEGFGIPVIEAMKSGCPVIASNSSSVQEISNNAALLIDSICDKKIADAIQSLRNPAFRQEKIKLGIMNATNYSWDKMANETLSFYNTIRGL
ncbi:glycosyltransferase family 4 protein [Escherichia coli]|nr:glycosyltransferase family 4 protein [Escherichia coli]